MTDVSAGLSLTGERTLPGIWHENYWFQRHLAAYEAVRAAAPGGVVVEAGCGEGYGAALLAPGREAVIALDYDASAVAHVRRAHPDVPVLQANLVALPLRDRSVDAVVSLQTLEHVWDQDAFLAECVRVLRPTGMLALSTPNRLTFSPGLGPGEKPRNPFHSRELAPGELVNLLSEHGTVTAIRGLRHGPAIREWERSHGSVVDAQLARPYRQWDPGLAGLVAALTVDDFTLAADELATCLDLITLATPARSGSCTGFGEAR